MPEAIFFKKPDKFLGVMMVINKKKLRNKRPDLKKYDTEGKLERINIIVFSLQPMVQQSSAPTTRAVSRAGSICLSENRDDTDLPGVLSKRPSLLRVPCVSTQDISGNNNEVSEVKKYVIYFYKFFYDCFFLRNIP